MNEIINLISQNKVIKKYNSADLFERRMNKSILFESQLEIVKQKINLSKDFCINRRWDLQDRIFVSSLKDDSLFLLLLELNSPPPVNELPASFTALSQVPLSFASSPTSFLLTSFITSSHFLDESILPNSRIPHTFKIVLLRKWKLNCFIKFLLERIFIFRESQGG